VSRSRFILIRGAPGSGKSSTARALARHYPRGATIEVDLIRRSMNGIIWHNHHQHFDALHIMAAMAHAFVERGYGPVIIVDTLGFGSLEMALEALATDSAAVYSLVCDPRRIAYRLWKRPGGFRDIRKAHRFNRHILEEGESRQDLIDTGSATEEEVCRQILALEQEANVGA
jgi:predicted kinase